MKNVGGQVSTGFVPKEYEMQSFSAPFGGFVIQKAGG